MRNHETINYLYLNVWPLPSSVGVIRAIQLSMVTTIQLSEIALRI